MINKFLSLMALLAFLLVPACQVSSGQVQVTLMPGQGAFAGQVQAAPQTWPDESELFIYAAPFYGKSGEGFYTLDPARHPSTRLDGSGYFQMNNIPPGSYVLIVGPSAEEGRLVVEKPGKPLVIEAQAGSLKTLGVLNLAP